jgi:hypothetical protein
MAISTSRGKSKQPKVAFDMDLDILDRMISFLLTDNKSVTRRAMNKMKELFSILDEASWSKDRNKEVRVFMVNTLLRGCLDLRLTDKGLLAESVFGGEYDDEVSGVYADIDNSPDGAELSNETVNYVEEWVSERLQFAFHWKYHEDLSELNRNFAAGEFKSLREHNAKMAALVESLHADIRKSAVVDKHASQDFSTDPQSLRDSLVQTQLSLLAPSNVIKTGVQWLNQMVGPGGFQASRVYVFLAITGGWKSGMLLNIALDAVRHNPDIQAKDPTRRPCVLYVTQENSIEETNERITSYHLGTAEGLKDIDAERLAEAAEQSDPNGILLCVKHRPNRSLRVCDLDAMCEELETDGKEVVMIVQDYLKRIRSNDGKDEAREEFGEVVNDMSTLSKSRGIPVVTASQLNREAFRQIEAAAGKRTDMAKLLGMSHIGESALILENADGVFIQHREDMPDGRQFLTVKKLKLRGQDTAVSYFAHPMQNTMRLCQDIHLEKTLSLREMSDGLGEFDPNGGGQAAAGAAAAKSRLPRRQAGNAPAKPPLPARRSVADLFAPDQEEAVAEAS